jgi:acetyl-CoA carboxylase biotin carboxyl carrier protein
MNIARLAELIKAVSNSTIAELEIVEGSRTIHLRRVPTQRVAAAEPQAARSEPAGTEEEGCIWVTSPVVGVFSWGDHPIQEGDVVTEGQIVGVVESMRLINPVRAQASGTVLRVLVHNGDPVEYGQNLLVLRPDAGAVVSDGQADRRGGGGGASPAGQ